MFCSLINQIYQAFPDVQGVVHSHTAEVLPFAAANVPLKAQMHTVRRSSLFHILNENARNGIEIDFDNIPCV